MPRSDNGSVFAAHQELFIDTKVAGVCKWASAHDCNLSGLRMHSFDLGMIACLQSFLIVIVLFAHVHVDALCSAVYVGGCFVLLTTFLQRVATMCIRMSTHCTQFWVGVQP